MPEPTSTAAAATQLSAAAAGVPMLTAFGVGLGLRADLLIAGFSGALVAVILLNTVPSTDDTWRGLIRTTGRRMAVTFAGSLTAGYLTPLMLPGVLLAAPSVTLGLGFVIGAGAQQALQWAIRRRFPPAAPTTGAGEGQA